ncbi:MAG: dephospho-CoA kinase [Gammaproteobacteria bacterium]
MTRPYTVALTGGIASGKSMLTRHFAEAGATVIDVDRISRQLTETGSELYVALRETLADHYFRSDGTMDRRALRFAIAQDPELRHRLETILHPKIWAALAEAVMASKADWILVVIPLLAESAGHWQIPIDRVLVIDCLAETQIQRLVKRDDVSPDDARCMLTLQASRIDRLALADDLVINEDGWDALSEAARSLARDYAAHRITETRQTGSRT